MESLPWRSTIGSCGGRASNRAPRQEDNGEAERKGVQQLFAKPRKLWTIKRALEKKKNFADMRILHWVCEVTKRKESETS